MKVWSICSVMSCSVMSLLACSPLENEHAEAKFAVSEVRAASSYYHAQYRFSHADYEDVDIAVRIKISSGNPSEMEVKDLTQPASEPVETVTLSASGADFVGTSSGATGGSYRVMLAVGACCGSIRFTPSALPTAIFVGTKSRDLTEAEWEGLQSGSTTSTNIGGAPMPQSHFHAKYVFTHADYEDVEVAVRITHIASKLSMIEVKGLTPPASKDPVETVTLSADGTSFGGWSSGTTGGYYRVYLNGSACCGYIYFWPASRPSDDIHFTGTKSEDLTAAQWAQLSAQRWGTQGSAPFPFPRPPN